MTSKKKNNWTPIGIGSQDISSWKGPQELPSLMLCSKQDQLWDQTGLLRALLSQAFKTFKDGDDTTFLRKFSSA